MKRKTITGLVTGIVDGNTIEVSFQQSEASGDSPKPNVETIRIQGLHHPAATTLSGILAKLELEKKIAGRLIECEIVDRDDSDQLIAVIPKKYFRSPFDFDPDDQ